MKQQQTKQPIKTVKQDTIENLLETLNMTCSRNQIKKEEENIIKEFLQKEVVYRSEHKVRKLLSSCGLKKHQLRTFENFDWKFNLKLPREDIFSFKNSDWINSPRNLVMIGDAGVGKTHWARSLVYDAIIKGETAYFITAFDLINKIKNAVRPDAKVNRFGNHYKVLVIDELGYTAQTKESGDVIFQIIAKRAETLPTIITTNLAPKQWGSLFAGTAATAILDRLSYNGSFLMMEGPSYRGRPIKK